MSTKDSRGRRRVSVHPAAPPGPSLPEIQNVCSYLTNDDYIANYFGIPLERVQQARKSMSPPNTKNRPSVTKNDDMLIDHRVHLDTAAAVKKASDRLLLRQLEVGQHWLTPEKFKEAAKQFGYWL